MNKVLLIEDDQILAKLYKTKFEKENFDIQLAFDGEEGLEKMKSFNPDLIILDLIMPKVDGFTFLQKVNEDPELSKRGTPILVLSNLCQESDVKKAMELGAKDFFIKADVSLSQMVEKVRSYLREPRNDVPISSRIRDGLAIGTEFNTESNRGMTRNLTRNNAEKNRKLMELLYKEESYKIMGACHPGLRAGIQ